MGRIGDVEDEPARAQSIFGPVLLVAVAMVFVHAAAGALLTAVAVTASPGPDTAGGLWDAAVWVAAVASAGAAARPLLRRVVRPLVVGATAGVLVAVGYSALVLGLQEADAVGLLALRAVSLAAAGTAAGLLPGSRS